MSGESQEHSRRALVQETKQAKLHQKVDNLVDIINNPATEATAKAKAEAALSLLSSRLEELGAKDLEAQEREAAKTERKAEHDVKKEEHMASKPEHGQGKPDKPDKPDKPSPAPAAPTGPNSPLVK